MMKSNGIANVSLKLIISLTTSGMKLKATILLVNDIAVYEIESYDIAGPI